LAIKKILITAGPTWVPIDGVRVISNTATGETAKFLIEEAKKKNIKVDLILGPLYFDSLLKLIKRKVCANKYDAVIHAAAVSDYQLVKPFKAKLGSDKGALTLRLKPTPKIVHYIKKWGPEIYLVMFKLESGVEDEILIKRSRSALIKAKADLVVANKIKPSYKAFILGKDKIYCKVDSKRALAKKLINLIAGL